jgi:hypothetical protein
MEAIMKLCDVVRETGFPFTLKRVVNAKTPRGKGARNREMARKGQV